MNSNSQNSLLESQKLHFTLQSERVCEIEKRIIRQASYLNDSEISMLSIDALKNGCASSFDLILKSTPVGSVEFVEACLRAVELHHVMPIPSYPACLARHFHREVKMDAISEARSDQFVKPILTKRFTGNLLKNLHNDAEFIEFSKSESFVWISDPVAFISEWRYYVLNGRLIGRGRYDDGADDAREPDLSVVQDAVTRVEQSMSIAGYSLDFGVLACGKTALVEMNDGWSLGFYKGSCHPVNYARLLHARWSQLISIRDKHQSTRNQKGTFNERG